MQTDIFHSFHFTFDEVQPCIEDIQMFLKSGNADILYPVNEAIRKILPLLSDNDDIKGGYILRRSDEVHLDIGSQIATYMKKADYLALFACTAGAIFTRLSNYYNREGDYLESFVTDAIGSLTVEKAMDKIQKQLEVEMQTEGLQISNRYSPGYCNWPVSGQRELFDRMGEISITISLTNSYLMLPIKSVSGIIGVGANIRKRPYACRICKNKNCIYRKFIQ